MCLYWKAQVSALLTCSVQLMHQLTAAEHGLGLSKETPIDFELPGFSLVPGWVAASLEEVRQWMRKYVVTSAQQRNLKSLSTSPFI